MAVAAIDWRVGQAFGMGNEALKERVEKEKRYSKWNTENNE